MSIDCRTPSGPEPTAQILLSGPDIVGKRDPSPSSSAQSPRSETKDWTLRRQPLGLDAVQRFCGRRDGLGLRASARRRAGPNACHITAHAATPVGSYLWKALKASTCADAALSLRGRHVTMACHAREGR
eukprot:scaffold90712_cov63-Phaeocystis_antarctica.AAC.2